MNHDYVGSAEALQPRPDLAGVCGGTTAHGYAFFVPEQFRKSIYHDGVWLLNAYAVAPSGGLNELLPKLGDYVLHVPRADMVSVEADVVVRVNDGRVTDERTGADITSQICNASTCSLDSYTLRTQPSTSQKLGAGGAIVVGVVVGAGGGAIASYASGGNANQMLTAAFFGGVIGFYGAVATLGGLGTVLVFAPQIVVYSYTMGLFGTTTPPPGCGPRNLPCPPSK